ncbi:WxL domain-containing protein [Candidatus Enterococcus mansonii]|uniref:WxL domain-containing protein n=1 Tax=Candidatus Enterococcus mansonii TaxID=1834181 RepID=A0A242CI68_9ENTE|nr:WxL domain-containing protein [Enterococcus sp. 4G2_DIV0659]OTO09828.1 hypothetical protein A5880_000511 [Enterococcus sp. 4G2_DIV0659]
MKKRTLCSIALLAAVGANIALPSAAQATATEFKGHGSINFVEDNTTNPPVDPENPDKPIIVDPTNPEDPDKPIIVNPDGGPLSIDALSNLQFMTQSATLTDQRYFAKQVPITQTEGNVTGVRGNYVQVTDKRLDQRGEWKLQAALSKQFTAAKSTDTLDGATITYTNPIINAGTGFTGTAPQLGTQASSVELTVAKGAVDFMGTKTAEQGKGQWILEFGNTAGYTSNVAASKPTAADSTGTPDATDPNKIDNGSVSLFVPGGAVKSKDKYVADITWTIVNGPIG